MKLTPCVNSLTSLVTHTSCAHLREHKDRLRNSRTSGRMTPSRAFHRQRRILGKGTTGQGETRRLVSFHSLPGGWCSQGPSMYSIHSYGAHYVCQTLG